jgi:hypothetical protein
MVRKQPRGVDREQAVELLGRDVEDVLALLDPGVADDDLRDRPEGARRAVHEPGHGRLGADVGVEGGCGAAQGGDLRSGRRGQARVDVDHRHGAALRGEPQRDGPPDPAAAARDKRSLPVQSPHGAALRLIVAAVIHAVTAATARPPR